MTGTFLEDESVPQSSHVERLADGKGLQSTVTITLDCISSAGLMLTTGQKVRKLPKGNKSCSHLFDFFGWGAVEMFTVEAEDQEKDLKRITRAPETVGN